MVTIEHTKEGLSRAYISAVAHKAGVNLSLGKYEFDYGIDGSFAAVQIIDGTKRHQAGANVNFQLKATVTWRDFPTEVAYDLDAISYNKIVEQNRLFAAVRSAVPTALIVLCLPSDEADWLAFEEQHLLLRKCVTGAI